MKRLLARLGLDLDFSIRMDREPFHVIADGLYLGALPTPDQVALLKETGITHVASCLGEEDRARVAFLRRDFRPLFIPIRDGMHEDIASQFAVFFDFVRDAHDTNARSKILVHCEVGVSRSATLTIALLMQQSRKQFFEAFCDVRAKRPGVLPNIGFASQLQRLEFDMHPRAAGDQSGSSLARYLKEVCMVPVELETIQEVLDKSEYDALTAIQAIFGDDIPRVIQGVRK